MRLAILFWFYKEPDVCVNRLELFRRYNPDARIFGLFGGDNREAPKFETLLSDYLEDFYLCPFDTPVYKWRHGDLALLDWYYNRGRTLEWDSVFVFQWDLLVFVNIKEYFSGLRENQIMFTALATVDERLKKKVDFLRPDCDVIGPELPQFCDHVKKTYAYEGPLFLCLFVVEVFPRLFFEKYLGHPDRELGFLEYKIPTLAHIWGIDTYHVDLGMPWCDLNDPEDRARLDNFPIITQRKERTKDYILEQLQASDGHRLFHPYWGLWDVTPGL